jgi:radical SAM/Cys-rich protein
VSTSVVCSRQCVRPAYCSLDAANISTENLDKRESRRASERNLCGASLGIPPFESMLENGGPLIRRASPSTLQINIGLTCNLACRHCHVESSPSRLESMSRSVADRLIYLTSSDGDRTISTVDITGGAPELHEQFRYLVKAFRVMGLNVIDRCNLTVLGLPGQEDLVDFLADNCVKVVASLPCYTPTNVEQQRGEGVFDESIRALRALNFRGYGNPSTGLELDLVFNPLGGVLPPPQAELEQDYRREMDRAFGIRFNRLSCITNMPIKRFADDLRRAGNLVSYMQLLVASFNPNTVDSVMCRDMVHVSSDGRVFDCDFNYALDLGLPVPSLLPDACVNVFDIESWSEVASKKIRTGLHCFGCTAGSGSSCGGALEVNA